MLEKLGPYHLQRMLGRGGMGAVYAATHEDSGQEVAIKVLAAAFADNERFRSRFASEIETLKMLRHPNIVQLFGYGEQEGMLFYAMELVNGRSLHDELQRGTTFHWRDAVRIGIDVSQALKHAHDCGVIHRDLKPANLLLAEDQSIKLTDFGIAKLFGGDQITMEGSVIGTVDYMAPEQAEGVPVTSRADLYSLGAVLFALLARRPPFTKASLPQTIHALRFDPAPSIRSFAPNIPEELDRIIDELLQKDPQRRIPTALVLGNRLKAMQHALAGPTRLEVAADEELSLEPVADDDSDSFEAAEHGSATATVLTANSLLSGTPPTPATSSNARTDISGKTDTSDLATAGRPVSTHYTDVHVSPRQAEQPKSQPPSSSSERWTIIGMAAGLIALIVVIVFAIRGPSADRLHQRIQQLVQADRKEDAKDLMEEFLKRFPSDARSTEVADLRMDVECDWLQSRLALRQLRSAGSDLEPFEKTFLEAMRTRAKEPEKARAAFQSIIDQFGDEPDANVRPYVDASRHQLKRMN